MKMPKLVCFLVVAVPLNAIAGGLFEENPAPESVRPWVEKGETCDRLYELSLRMQERLLEHYASQPERPPAEVAFVLGRNLFLSHRFSDAEKWLAHAAEGNGAASRMAGAWLAALEFRKGNQAAAMMRWQTLSKVSEPAVYSEVLYARAEAGRLSTFEEVKGGSTPALASATFAARISVGGPLLPQTPLAPQSANRPLLTIPLGKVRFSDKTLDYDLRLYDPLVLHFAALHSWKMVLRNAQEGFSGLRVRALRRSGDLAKACSLELPQKGADWRAQAEQAAAFWRSGRNEDAEKMISELALRPSPEKILYLSGLGAELDWQLQFWIDQVQACLRTLRGLEEYQRLSAAHFETAVRPFLWRLAELRWRLAVADRPTTSQARPALDAALQTLDLAYKRTERHRLSKFRPRELAIAAGIYLAADRLDEALYYPLDESMLPAAYPACRFLRDQASRLQAVLKLGSPQLTSRTVEPVRHLSRQELLFGEERTVDSFPSAQTANAKQAQGGRRSQLPLLVAAAGLLLILLAAVMGLKRKPDFGQGGKEDS